MKLLREGKDIALVSDAGTPGISDPGFSLIKSVIEAGIKVVSVPGPTALISALSISGFPANKFFFAGFLPAKSGARKKRLQWLKKLDETVVLYESPHRILKTLGDLGDILGVRQIAVVREVTKTFEEVARGDAGSLLEKFKSSRPRGEFVIIF